MEKQIEAKIDKLIEANADVREVPNYEQPTGISYDIGLISIARRIRGNVYKLTVMDYEVNVSDSFKERMYEKLYQEHQKKIELEKDIEYQEMVKYLES